MSSSPKRKLLVALAILAALPVLACWIAPRLLPYGGQAQLDQLEFSQVFLDKAGRELQVLPLAGGLRRVFVPLDKLPAELLEIVLQAEDRHFWFHPGVDPASIIRAAWQNQSAGRTVSGASTVSMQLARLLHPDDAAGASKPREAWEALQLETRLGKRGVLELYLNLVPFGQNIEGFPAAARVFFGKPLDELSRSELMCLAVVPRSPGIYNPFAQADNNRTALLRLAAGQPGQLAVDDLYQRVRDPGRPGIWPFRTPQYIRWLSAQSAVQAKRGRGPFRTAIEPELQGYLEQLLARTVDEARSKRVSNAAALFIRPEGMEIAAWVGSVDFDDAQAKGQIDGVTMQRQPGSTLKPFLYSLALEQGLSAASILPDIPTDFGGAEVYTPANFNDQFNGPVRLRQALASSLNVPAVYMLQRIGVMPFTERLVTAGFASLENQRGKLGLGLALGNAELSLFELVQAYGLFLHDGRFAPIQPTQDRAGVQVMQPPVAQLIRDILTRHPDRVLAFGRGSSSRLQFESAMKTGTSNQFNNIWAVGFTPDLLGGVWLGNFDGQTVVGTADSGYPASVMAKMLETFSAHDTFPLLEGFQRITICSLSGMAAGESCPHTMQEWFIPGSAPSVCDWHSGSPANPDVHYPQEYQTWLRRYRYQVTDSFQTAGLAILRPQDGAVFFRDPGLPLENQQISIECIGSGNATLSIDGTIIYEGTFPFRTWFKLNAGNHTIKLSNGQENIQQSYEVR